MLKPRLLSFEVNNRDRTGFGIVPLIGKQECNWLLKFEQIVG